MVLLIVLSSIFIANNVILFLPNDIGSWDTCWIINSVLFGLLALFYLVTFCYL